MENTEDRKMINLAKSTFGDYKLKMSMDYVVPEKDRVNAERKRQQMVLLENSIFNLKVEFNRKVEELKIQKVEIFEQVKAQNERIREINLELGQKEDLFEPKIDEVLEYPENFFNVTDKEIAEFVKVKAKRAQKEVKRSMFGGKREQKGDEEKEEEEEARIDKGPEAPKELAVIERKRKAQAPKSAIEDEFKEMHEIELQFEKEQLVNAINQSIEQFDDTIQRM